MKKSYVKPQVYFEDFRLSANIAGVCGIPTGHAENECKWSIPITGIGNAFVTMEMGCTHYPKDGEYNNVCYHVPYDASRLFTS